MCKPSQREDQFSGAAVEHVACSHKGLARSYVHAHFRAVAMSNFTLSILVSVCSGQGGIVTGCNKFNSDFSLRSDLEWAPCFIFCVCLDWRETKFLRLQSWNVSLCHFDQSAPCRAAKLQQGRKLGPHPSPENKGNYGTSESVATSMELWAWFYWPNLEFQYENVTKVTKVTKSLMFAGRSQTALVSSDSW